MKSQSPNDFKIEDFEAFSGGEAGNACVLTDECQKIDIIELLRKAKLEFKKALIQSQLQLEGIQANLTTTKTGFGGDRLWFKCPICSRKVGVFYRHPLSNIVGCWKCLNLEYRSRVKRGTIEDSVLKTH